jgi:hypothetical protein
MLQLNIRVFFFQFPSLGICLHSRMAVGAREDTFAERRTRDRKVFLFGPSIEDPAEHEQAEQEAQ